MTRPDQVSRQPSTHRGVLWIHSTPSALCPHIEWALGGAFGVPTHLDWTSQPAQPGTYRAELVWLGRAGTAAAVTSALQRWQRLRFEMTEHAIDGHDGIRYSVTPSLGTFHAIIGPHGDVLVHEERLRHALVNAADLAGEINRMLGQPWDQELEAFRHAGADTSVRWLARSFG